MNISASSRRSAVASRLAVAVLCVAAAVNVAAGDGDDGAKYHYAARGQVFDRLPGDAMSINYRGERYFYRGGEWYRPRGSRFVVVVPPIGAVVPFLPGGYLTFWFGGIPYYFANDAYYLWRPELNGYVVTAPPDTAGAGASASSPMDTEPFVYPKSGQTAEQQATDRYECHRWAKGQTNFDPTDVPGTATTADVAAGRRDYLRALTACLEGRGYSVK